MRIAVFAVIALDCVAGCSGAPHAPVKSTPSRSRVVAHRGASYEAPENTLAAFRRAWALGVEAVELDVRVTKDGEVVVLHDESTLRTAGVDRRVADQTLPELRTLDVGTWKHIKYQEERIPTLAEALSTIPAGRTMFVEIKSPSSTATAIAEVIERAQPTSVAIALQGFDADALAALAALLPDAPAYWTLDPPRDASGQQQPYSQELIAEAKGRGFAGLALDYRAVSPELLAVAARAEISIDVWTLNDTALLTDWLRRNVRWIETDRPELAP